LPSVNAMAAALQGTTEHLAHELAAPTNQPPIWTDFQWDIASAVAAMHGISSLLRARLRWQGAGSWREFLDQQHEQSMARHRQITELLGMVDAEAGRRNVGCVALKGAALQAMGLYAAGERPMGDIDLLVRSEDVEAFGHVLESCGYEALFETHRHRVFQPRVRKIFSGIRLGEHVDNPLKVELHTKVAEHLPVTQIDITQLLIPRELKAGVNAYPSLSSVMAHLLLHAAGNMRAHALRLLQLHDIALLARRFSAADWTEFVEFADRCSLWWAYAPAILTSRYYRGAIPPDVLQKLGIDCPLWLSVRARKLRVTTVSWSNIRIAAFPGLEWSRTSLEALAFMRGRISPSRQARAELKDGAAQIPESSTVRWYNLPHRARILRWVFSRPPRVQTLLSVRAALGRHA
jgi:hypothetical protein